MTAEQIQATLDRCNHAVPEWILVWDSKAKRFIAYSKDLVLKVYARTVEEEQRQRWLNPTIKRSA